MIYCHFAPFKLHIYMYLIRYYKNLKITNLLQIKIFLSCLRVKKVLV